MQLATFNNGLCGFSPHRPARNAEQNHNLHLNKFGKAEIVLNYINK
jgi:hypothetical protein